MELTKRHVLEGGTFITNFHHTAEQRYLAAIKNTGIALIISDEAFASNGKRLDDYKALHSPSGSFPDSISDFWRVYEKSKQD